MVMPSSGDDSMKIITEIHHALVVKSWQHSDSLLAVVAVICYLNDRVCVVQ